MQRLTISVNKQLAVSFDQLIARKGYRNRSEAFRDLLRKTLSQETLAAGSTGQCVACVSYVFDNGPRRLAERLAELRQRFGGVAVSATLAPIDRHSSMETLILRGAVDAVARLAEAIVAETGVRHGQLNLVPIEAEEKATEKAAEVPAVPAPQYA